MNTNNFIKTKGSALLMILLIITIIGAVALTLSRSLIAGAGFTVNISDAMGADQASNSGIQNALYKYSNNLIPAPFPASAYNYHLYISDYSSADYTVTQDSNTGLIFIESIGRSGGVYKRHTLQQVKVL